MSIIKSNGALGKIKGIYDSVARSRANYLVDKILPGSLDTFKGKQGFQMTFPDGWRKSLASTIYNNPRANLAIELGIDAAAFGGIAYGANKMIND